MTRDAARRQIGLDAVDRVYGKTKRAPEHLEAALALWEYCEQSARWIFGTATGDSALAYLDAHAHRRRWHPEMPFELRFRRALLPVTAWLFLHGVPSHKKPNKKPK
jgi:hypothetical protein